MLFICYFSISFFSTYLFIFFFFNDTATTEIYTLSLHDALPISVRNQTVRSPESCIVGGLLRWHDAAIARSEEHTSELQSLTNLVCRLLLEKKKKKNKKNNTKQTHI